MSIESEIARLLQDGRGEVLWLTPRHAKALEAGEPASDRRWRAIVLQGVLGLLSEPDAVLRRLADRLEADGELIAVVGSRMNPRVGSGSTRRELLGVLEAVGYDVTSCQLIPDPRVWAPIIPDGERGRQAEELEESASLRLLVSARRALAEVPLCSIVTTSAEPVLHTLAEPVEVISMSGLDGDLRCRAWNRAARAARGRYIAFLDAGSRPQARWLQQLLQAMKSGPAVAAAGVQRVALGSASLPCHQLPFRVNGDEAGPVSAVEGNGMLLDRRTFVALGGFDENLGPQFDGPDLCLRLRARGLQIAHGREAFEVAASAQVPAPTASGVRYFLSKWRGLIPPDAEPAQARRPPSPRRSPAPVLWSGPMLQRSGYGEEARSFVLALDREGVAVQANMTDWHAETQLPRYAVSRLSALAVTEAPETFINVVHSFPVARMAVAGTGGTYPLVEHFKPHPKAVRNIGRTMYETDRIPPEWVEYCNAMDEVWVPSEFNVETFSRAGVAREKLFRVPGAIDTELFDPHLPPMHLPGAHGFVFLSVFAWSLRKGWDVLVRAFKEEFDHGEDVTLVLKVLPHWNRTLAQHQSDLDTFTRQVLGRDPGERPRLLVISRDMVVDEMPRLYRAADAFVLASRGEAYGRPYLEAMAMGLPTIGTRGGGNLDFMSDENSYLVDCKWVDVPEAGTKEIPDYKGHRWWEPDVNSLRQALRRVFEERAEAQAKAAQGRRTALERHSWAPVARAVEARLTEGGVRPLRSRPPDSLPVTWEGPYRIAFGIAEVNREVAGAMHKSPAIDLNQVDTPRAQPWLWGRPPDVTVRHQWPPNFEAPRKGRWVTYQPWEYGSLPAAWVEPMNREMDEVWVPSNYVRECYIRSAVDPDKVAVVPYGIDPARFHPGAPPMKLPTKKKYRFLFVGGTIARKGIDILLDTYVSTFGPDDDVSLVIKDLGASTFYGGQSASARIRQLQSDATKPEIVYLDAELPADQMPGLFTACQCLVHPYRGEGFGLPIAEAMACGLAVIVPRHGACLDFCDESVAYLVEASEVRLPEARVGAIPTVEPGWWAEVDRKALAAAMRSAVDRPEEARAVGRRAATKIRRELTWERAAGIASGRLEALARRPAEITACLIVKDEERSLARCLKSLRGIAAEVVVVDTGSTDRTVEVARKLGAKVSQLQWSSDFAAARNEALRRATRSWVLVIDADEWLDEAGVQEIRCLVQSEAIACYALRQVTHGPGADAGVEQLRSRLFPNVPALRFAGRVGEQLETAGLPIIPSGAIVHHDGSSASRKRRLKRILPLLVDETVRQAEDPAPVFELGLAYMAMGMPAKAERETARAVDRLLWSPPDTQSSTLAAEVYALRAAALLSLGRHVEAEQASGRALSLAPDHGEAHAYRADALAAQGRLDAAAAEYRTALECTPRVALLPVDRAATGWRSLLGLAGVEFRLGREEEARELLLEAGSRAPRVPQVRAALAKSRS